MAKGKEEEDEIEEAEEVEETDLTQLPGVDEELAKSLNEQGYLTLWEVAYETEEVLAEDAGITKLEAINIIDAAKKLLELEEEEEEEWPKDERDKEEEA